MRILRAFVWLAALLAAGIALHLRVRHPDLLWRGWPAASWLAAGFLAFLAARIAALAGAAIHGRLPWTRLLIPAIAFVEGLGFLSGHAPAFWRAAKLGLALGLELGLLLFTAYRFLRLPAEPGVLPEDHLARPLEAFLPRAAARIVALELVMIGTALRFASGGWRRVDPPGFSYHRESALGAILPALPLLLLGDVLLLEVLMRSLHPWIRAFIHLLDLYGILWVLGLWASFRRRPHTLEDGRLRLHKGLLARLDLRRDQIASVGPLPPFPDDWARLRFTRQALQFQAPGAPQLCLELNAPARAIGLLGLGPAKTRVIVSADDPEGFRGALRA